MAITEHAFGKRVHSRFRGDRLVTLGVDDTCGSSQFRTLGSECQKLVLKKDGFYHCEMCGLVFEKPELIVAADSHISIRKICACKRLTNVQKMVFSRFAGCTIPINAYYCGECGRKYHSPYYCREASFSLQESVAAKAHVKEILKNKKLVLGNKIDKILRTFLELKKLIEELPRKERKVLLDKMASMIS